MKPSDDIEKRLREAPLPGLKDGSHRDSLKQALLAEMKKETAMNDKAPIQPPTTESPTTTKRRWHRSRWIATPIAVAIVALFVVWFRTTTDKSPESFDMTGGADYAYLMHGSTDHGENYKKGAGRLATPYYDRISAEGLVERRFSFATKGVAGVKADPAPVMGSPELPAAPTPPGLITPGDSRSGHVYRPSALPPSMPPYLDKGKKDGGEDHAELSVARPLPLPGLPPAPTTPPPPANAVKGLAPAGTLKPDAKGREHTLEILPPSNLEAVPLPHIAPEVVAKLSVKGKGLLVKAKERLEQKAINQEQFLDELREIMGGDNYAHRTDNPFHKAAQTPLSTFSIDVDTASYTNVRRFLTQEKHLPPKDSVRIEELVNYFVYDDPRPKDGKPVAIKTEVGPCPWNSAHKLVRIGLRAKSVTAEESPPRNLTFLVDTSGSMMSPDRLPLLKQGLAMLVGTLRPVDRVAIVAYAGSAGLVLPSTAGSEKQTILAALNRLEAGGSTNGGQGIELAYKIAQESFIKDGVNRVVLGTDGDFNVGTTSDGDLVRMIEERRKTGIFLSILGFGHGNLKDATMEKLAHHGNGHYAYIDNAEEAHRIFVEQGAALQVVAGDVKVQVEFNPSRVGAYRLIGYENRLMKDQDFNDDKKDAGDMGSGHVVTALYEIAPAGKEAAVPGDPIADVDPLRYQKTKDAGLTDAAKSNELMLVKIRYKDPGAEKSKLLTQPALDSDRPLAQTSSDFRFAAAVAEFGLILRDSPYKGKAAFANVIEQARGSLGLDAHGHRAAFVQMVQGAQQLR